MTDYLIYLTLALFLTQCLDFYTTRTILSKGGKELNPAAKWFMDEFGMDEFLVGKIIAVTAVGYWVGTQNLYILGALVVFYTGIIIFNYRSMK